MMFSRASPSNALVDLIGGRITVKGAAACNQPESVTSSNRNVRVPA
ncbi:MAG: hypothetical protein ABF504_16065 [Komagataeibacter saccharivorans]